MITMQLLVAAAVLLLLPATSCSWPFARPGRALQQQRQQVQQQHSQQQDYQKADNLQAQTAVSAEEVLQQSSKQPLSAEELQTLQLRLLRKQVEQLPMKIEQLVRCCGILNLQVHSLPCGAALPLDQQHQFMLRQHAAVSGPCFFL